MEAHDEKLGLVLSGGGARAAYQVGVLAYLAEQKPDFFPPIMTGVSAGAINAAYLASTREDFPTATKELVRSWEGFTLNRVFHCGLSDLAWSAIRVAFAMVSGGSLGGPEIRGIFDTEPLHQHLMKTLDLSGVDFNISKRRLRALALTSMSYTTGNSVTFVQGEAGIPSWQRSMRIGIADRVTIDHVMASSALPLVFPAMKIKGEYFGDGAVRQSTPLAPAVHIGASKILAISVRHPRETPDEGEDKKVEYPSPAQIFGLMAHSVFLDALDADAERLRRINRLIALLPEDKRKVEHLKTIKLFVVRPSEDLGSLAARFWHTLPASFTLFLRSIGARREKGADFISYLMFTPPYLKVVMELGYRDAADRWPEIKAFLEMP